MSSPSLRESRFGSYVASTAIGCGGMGVVYRARHQTTGLEVALKTIRAPAVELVAAFRREVQVLAQLEHPGIVRIIEHDFSADVPWYAMELVEGRSLAALLQRGWSASDVDGDLGPAYVSTLALEPAVARPLSAPVSSNRGPSYFSTARAELIRLARRICEALAFLHERGLVHRDLKPENVLVRPSGEPVLVDFGLVATFSGHVGRDVLDFADAGGTFAYMAPEQKLGRFVDARADLFSLGCILYECITGELPFGPLGARDFDVEAPRSSTLSPEVPAELDTLVARLLAGNPR